MHYAISDIHGWPQSDILQLLKKAGFSDDDELYVLGDVIDRNGDGGIETLLWMMQQPNVTMLLGNHEATLLANTFLLEPVTDELLDSLQPEHLDLVSRWMENGATVTLESLRKLQKENPALLNDLLDYLRDAPLYEALSLPQRDVVLVHAGLGNYSPDKKLSVYTPDDLIWHRPTADERYSDTILTVFGHTPTGYLDPACSGRMLRTDTWINIDAGAAGGHPPMLLCLETLTPYYLNA